MLNLRNLLKNFNLLNIILIIACFYFANFIVLPMLSLKTSYTLPSTKYIGENDSNELTTNFKIPSMSDYILISENNAFHPERKIPVEKKAEEEPATPPKPELVLYGTLISDDVSYAYIEDLKAIKNTPGRGRRQITLKKGDSLGGFVLKEIEADKITMIRGDEKIIVEVRNTQRSKTSQASVSTTPAKQQTASTPPRRLVPQTPPASSNINTSHNEPSSKAFINPPRNAEEQAIFNFFDKSKKD